MIISFLKHSIHSMINYKDKQKITAYIEYIKAYEDADYIGYFLNLTEEEKLKEINNED